jgi:hypothetical protein
MPTGRRGAGEHEMAHTDNNTFSRNFKPTANLYVLLAFLKLSRVDKTVACEGRVPAVHSLPP